VGIAQIVQHLKTKNAPNAKKFLFLVNTTLSHILGIDENRIFRQNRATSGKGRGTRHRERPASEMKKETQKGQ
jgi:hypothetical protein